MLLNIKAVLEEQMKSGNACYHSVQNVLSSSLLFSTPMLVPSSASLSFPFFGQLSVLGSV